MKKEILTIDVKNITGVQLLSDDMNLNTDPENILFVEVHNPVKTGDKPCDQGDYDVSYSKIIIRDIKSALKISLAWGDEDASPEAREAAYNHLLKRCLSAISIEENDDWKSYYFPCSGGETNYRMKITEGDVTTIVCEKANPLVALVERLRTWLEFRAELKAQRL